jgi:hypothetical protein
VSKPTSQIPQVHIRQVKHKLSGDQHFGQWYCVASVDGPDGLGPINRYLTEGGWQKNTEYFDSEESVRALLGRSQKPDFTVSPEEHDNRQFMHDDMMAGFDMLDEMDDASHQFHDYDPADDGDFY